MKPEGYYWVLLVDRIGPGGEWTVALWRDERWNLIGCEDQIDAEGESVNFAAIGPRIEPPAGARR